MQALSSSAVLQLFGFLIGLSSSLDPRDPNACSLWEYTTSVKESYSHPYDHVTEEPCSDPRTSYRCSRHITYKTAYRQAVKTEHRRRYHCCPGYYESGGRCVHCSKECVHGRCVAPNRCQCEKGWRGDDCSSCDDRHWGPDCQKECKCENGALCDPVRGVCQCPPGFIGRLCDSCPAGTFGKGCQQRCKCGNGGSCNKATGECTCQKGFTGTCKGSCQPRCPCQNEGRCKGNGVCACLAGWTGAICTEQCPEGRFGKNCSEECVCHNGAKCDPLTGRCQCREGFTGNCNEECTAGTYGQDCKGVCNCANGARCFNIDGSCFCEPGFSGPQCRNRMCGPGNYGMHCEHKCLCEEKHTLCHPMKGECTCQPGWAGLFCNETCPHGFYGDGCMEPCLCVNGGVCDSATGRCHCSPGFTGVHCESPCKTGTYGKNCSLECSCENFIDCSPVDGTCFCKEWQGPDCSVPCADGTWGPGCNATCRCTNGAKCDPADGSCKCSAGWQGALCDQPCDGLVRAGLPEEVRLYPRQRLPGDQREVPLSARLDAALQSMSGGPVGPPLQPLLLGPLSQQRHVSEENRGVCVPARLLGRRLPEPGGQRHGPSAPGGEGVVGRHRRHRGAGPAGGDAAGSAAALPAPAEGQAEQHAHRLLLHQPHRQLRIRRPSSPQLPSLLLQPQLPHAEPEPAAAAAPPQQPRPHHQEHQQPAVLQREERGQGAARPVRGRDQRHSACRLEASREPQSIWHRPELQLQRQPRKILQQTEGLGGGEQQLSEQREPVRHHQGPARPAVLSPGEQLHGDEGGRASRASVHRDQPAAVPEPLRPPREQPHPGTLRPASGAPAALPPARPAQSAAV
uniref:Platelet endothelial aggregation receptor 1 n=1 Tax=Poecilia latipinna TaxID=48699 RepID=A0A3B3USA3_9TELE